MICGTSGKGRGKSLLGICRCEQFLAPHFSPDTHAAGECRRNDVGDVEGNGQAQRGSQSFGTQQIGGGDEEHEKSGDQGDGCGLLQFA